MGRCRHAEEMIDRCVAGPHLWRFSNGAFAAVRDALRPPPVSDVDRARKGCQRGPEERNHRATTRRLDRGHTGDKVNLTPPQRRLAPPKKPPARHSTEPLLQRFVTRNLPRRLVVWEMRRIRGTTGGPGVAVWPGTVIVISALGVLAAVVWGLLS